VSRTVRNSLIVVAALILGYPALAWVLGLMVQHSWEEREQRGLQQIPGYAQYVTIAKRDYRRGIYSSTEEVTFRLGEKILKTLRASGNVAWTDHVQIVIRNTIHHGPFPQLRDFAPATVDSEWILPPEIQGKLAAAFKGKANLAIHTRLNWSGGGTTLVSSPAFNLPLEKAAAIDWRGLEAHIVTGREIGAGSVSLTAPGLSLKTEKGVTVSYQDLKLDSTLQPAYEVLNVGDLKMTLGQLQIGNDADENKPFKLTARNLMLESHSRLNGELVDAEGGITVEAVQVNTFDTNHINYAAHFTHIHGPAAAALTKALRAEQSDTPDNATPQEVAAANTKRMIDALKGPGIDLLVKEPVVDISHLGFAMPEGALDISLKASMPGVTKEEFQGAPDAVKAAFAKHLQLSADIHIDTAMLDKLLESTGKSENAAAQLQGLQRQGYIKLDGKTLTTHITFLGGQLKVNDQPFPPRPPGGPQ
jgi:uncharacterized protein YdgA (DUF945 family)